MDMHDKFEQLLKEKGETASDVAKETGIAKSTFSGWKHGRFVPKKEKMELIAKHFDVPVEYFYYDSVSDEYKERINNYIDMIRTYEVSAGSGRMNEGYETSSAPPKDSEIVRICGDSMLPTLRDGDLVRVIPATETTKEEYTIVKINGDEATCKHVEITDTGIWLRGENKEAYTDTFYSIQQVLTLPVQVIGKAVEIVSRSLL